MNILITGARALVAADFARRIKLSGGHRVIMADSLGYPLGRFCKYTDQYIRLAPPKQNVTIYIQDIINIIKKYKIDMVIPTCEEIFYLAKYRTTLAQHCHLFCDNFESLSSLHNKWTFLKHIHETPAIKKPKSYYCSSIDYFKSWMAEHDPSHYLIKPVFSRFGSKIIFDLTKITAHATYPVIIQENIAGVELCSYSIAVAGVIVAHATYQPKYKAGVGAGIFFEPMVSKKVLSFCEDVVGSLKFTGQIAFDFIERDGILYPIECNPRATSGLHLIAPNNDLIKLITGEKSPVQSSYLESTNNPMQITFGMLLYFLSNLKNTRCKDLFRDIFKTSDIFSIMQTNELHFYQFISFIEMLLRSYKHGLDLKQVSTHDIEWNGDELN